MNNNINTAVLDGKDARTMEKENRKIEKKAKKEEKLRKKIISQPVYTKGEEIFNYVSHIVGGAFGLFALIFGCIKISAEPAGYKYAAIIIYALSITVLYTMSALYHGLPAGKAKRVFRVFDHCTIFILIAGTYTPYCLIAFHGTVFGNAVFAVEWLIAIIGITFNAINMDWKAVKITSMAGYFIMGWGIILALPSLLKVLSIPSFVFLLLGGAAYTLGIIFFAFGKRVRYFHSVWHIFDLLGTVLQFVSIYFLL